MRTGEDEEERSPGPMHPAQRARLRPVGPHAQPPVESRVDSHVESGAGDDPEAEAELSIAAATEALVRRLRSKQLSSREARDVLRDRGLRREQIDEVIEGFEERGYLDDSALAEYLVTAGTQRRGQGRIAIGRTLAQRGIPRDVADAALSVLEDDDETRALEFARTKVSALLRVDDETALRRLVGQLARRGYGGGVAMGAARMAIREARRGSSGRSHGVRFEDGD